MTTVERKEYQETKVLRTRSPVRNFRSSNQNLAEFDHNLDYLLEDLQNSVSRPGSSMGNYRETSKTDSLSRVKNVKSSNPVTEYSSDDAYNYTTPDGKKVSGFKKEKYYKSSSSGPITEKRMENNINQLDTLLDDLQQAKHSSYEKSYERETYNNTGVDPDFLEGKNTTKSVNRELHYGDTPKSTSTKNHTLERSEREGSLSREYQYSSEGTYGQVRTTSPSPSSRTSTLTKQTKVQNVHSYPMEVIETTAPDIDPEVLAHLDPNLHPPGNTKVTTTIKTYTYEIPGSGDYPTNLDSTVESEKYVYSPNQTITTPSKSFTYSKVENKENLLNDKHLENYNYKEKEIYQSNKYYQKPLPPVQPSGKTVVKESITTRNYQPGYSPELDPPSTNQTYVYNEMVTTKSHDNYVPTTRTDTIMVEERDIIEYPAPKVEKQQETYFKETRDQSTNTLERYPNGHPPTGESKVFKYESHTERHNYKPEPVNIQYKYKSESKTVNNYKADYPNDSEPLLPKPFPTQTDGPAGPPKRLDELMETIGGEPPNSPYNAGYTAHEVEMMQKKKVESMKQQSEADDMQKKEPVQRSKNVTGPPVYYPPGHEMFAKKEEGAAWRAEGAYARGAGKYEYEAESKSKTKSSSGKAIVPVCLPLCCGLPCSIL